MRVTMSLAISCCCRYQLPSQQHMYMETQCSVAEPDESGGMSIVSSTQTLDGVQSAAARALGIPCHAVTACEPCRHRCRSSVICAPPCLPFLAAVQLKMTSIAIRATSIEPLVMDSIPV